MSSFATILDIDQSPVEYLRCATTFSWSNLKTLKLRYLSYSSRFGGTVWILPHLQCISDLRGCSCDVRWVSIIDLTSLILYAIPSEDNLLPCVQCFKEMHWTKLILLYPHSWIICIYKSIDSLYSCNKLLFPLHAWIIPFRVSVLLLHWWISTTSKADLRMPRSWTLSVLDGWVSTMMGWWITHNLCVQGFLSKNTTPLPY